MIVSCKRGEGEREMNDFVAGDADYGAFTEQEVVEELSDTESVEDVESEDSIIDSTRSTVAYDVEEEEQSSETGKSGKIPKT